jgi:hypothetical protein
MAAASWKLGDCVVCQRAAVLSSRAAVVCSGIAVQDAVHFVVQHAGCSALCGALWTPQKGLLLQWWQQQQQQCCSALALFLVEQPVAVMLPKQVAVAAGGGVFGLVKSCYQMPAVRLRIQFVISTAAS